jgi:hypothetical protein
MRFAPNENCYALHPEFPASAAYSAGPKSPGAVACPAAFLKNILAVIFVTARCLLKKANSIMALSLTVDLPAVDSESTQVTPSARSAATSAELYSTSHVMGRFAIINSRKRAIIALVHSVFFLGVAAVQLSLSHAIPFSFRGEKAVAGTVLLSIYLVVATVLLILLRFSRCARERLYFAFCAASAAFGLVRILFGDPVLHANVMRVLLLSCAVIIGAGILCTHSAKAPLAESEMPA